MLNNINHSDGLVSNSNLQESQGVLSAEKLKTGKNPYDKKLFLVDESQISQEAIKLYEQDKEIEKYKNMLSQVTEKSANKEIASLMQQGVIDISDDDLAEAMMLDKDLLKDLF